jgi:N-methylhydantoinase A
VIVPRFPAHFSALGMLLTDERHDFARTYYSELKTADFSVLKSMYAEMTENAQLLMSSGIQVSYQIFLDLRYVGQEFTLAVPVTVQQIDHRDHETIRDNFDELHEQRYAHHSKDESIEIINIRLVALGRRTKLALPPLARDHAIKARELRMVFFDREQQPVESPVFVRDALPCGATLNGPALVSEYGSTTVIFPKDRLTVADTGELIISVGVD